MDVITSVRIPDYIYEFYKIGAARLKCSGPEELIEIALKEYAGVVAFDLLKAQEIHLDEER